MTVWTPWEGYRFNPLSPLDWVDFREGSQSFQAWGVWDDLAVNLSGGGEPLRVDAIRASPGVFRALGIQADRGRLFLPEESGTSSAKVAVISHSFWQRQFGGDHELLGRDVIINQERWSVVGILPEGFRFPKWRRLEDPDLYLPVSFELEPENRGTYHLKVLGRLQEGVSREQAYQELSGIAARLAEAYPETNGHRIVQVVPVEEIVLGDSPSRIWILLGVTGFVLILACANVGGLLVARNLGRRTEMAVRTSLGAGRGRLTRQLLTEVGTLALFGGGVGLLLAWLGTDLLAYFLPPSLLAGMEVRVDGLVVSATLGSTLLTALIIGGLPAVVTPLGRSAGAVREGPAGLTPGRGQGRLLGAMVVIQFALAFVLMDGAGLMLQSLREVTSFQEMESPEKVVLLGYLEAGDPEGELRVPDPFLQELLTRIRGLPGVLEAGGSTTLPLQGFWTSDLLGEGQEYDPDRDVPSTHMIPASPGYLAAMGIELRLGRDLAPEDLGEGVVGVVATETFVDLRWPGENPLGKRIQANMRSDPWLEAVVVGVAEDVRQYGLESEAIGGLYLPFFPPFLPSRWIAVRAAGDPLALVPELRRTLRDLDPHRPVTRVFTGDALYESGARSRSATTRYFGLFALIALALAGTGTFGVMSFFVGQKMREMGIRVALGARKGEVAWLVLRGGLVLAGVGCGLGALGVLGVSGILQSMLYGVGALDPLFIGGSVVGLILVALATSAVPAVRAGRADPVEVIRVE
jgi:putative ABC transport system permease protein